MDGARVGTGRRPMGRSLVGATGVVPQSASSAGISFEMEIMERKLVSFVNRWEYEVV